MSSHQEFIPANELFASSFDKGGLALPPKKHLIVVTCMDARIDLTTLRRPLSQLGIELGDAHVIRNAGGSAQEALRSIVVSQRLLGTNEIAVFRHTDCGMLTFTNEQLREKLISAAPADEAVANAAKSIDFLPIQTLEESVKSDVRFLKENPLVLEGTTLTGWLYDVHQGKIQQIV